MAANDVTDPRAGFWKKHFDQAVDYETYLDKSDPEHAQRWRELGGKLPPLTDEQVQRLRMVDRELNVLVYSGVWCGDCVRQGPMFQAIATAAGPKVNLRLIDREASPELQQELRILGGRRVPVVVMLSEDFFEAGRFGDRLLSAYRVKADMDVGAHCSTGLIAPPGEQLAAEQADWVDVFERVLLMLRVSGHLRQKHGD